MEIIKLSIGENEEHEISFAEGEFSFNDESFFVYAISSGDMMLLVKADCSLYEMNQSIQEDDSDYIGCDYSVSSWDAKNKSSTASVVDLDIENVLVHCMESDLETYQCWRHDGNEGLYEASDSDAGLAFVVVHDLLATTGFPNVREMLEDDDTLTALLEEVDFNSGEEV